MSRKIKWLKSVQQGAPQGRAIGMVEINDDDLCARYVELGLAEYVKDGEKTDAEKKAEDLARRQQSVEGAEAKAVEESPVDRSLKSGTGKKK